MRPVIHENRLRLRVDSEELFLPFAEFPWFQGALVDAVLHVQRLSSGHLRWPELDVDLLVESIRHPERFPLIARRVAGR